MEAGTSPGAAPLADLEWRARHTQRVRTGERLRGGRIPLALVEIADHASRLAEHAVGLAARTDPPPPSACREGCDWCCHLTVGAGVPEVVRMVEYLRRTLTADEFGALRERVFRLDARRRELSGAPGDPQLPCALLVEHGCTAYPVRPLMCYGFNSGDATACERFLRSSGQTAVPLYAPQLRLAAFVLDGLAAGLTDTGLTGERVELTAALRIALEVPDAVERFLAGEPTFAAARLG
jgi:hypothetical protein